jgi:putative tricarboxylic transport membrane protein
MMDRLKAQVPYVVVLMIAGFLYYRATQIDFVAPGERIGPDVWPKAILALAMLTCAYEIVKNLLFSKGRHDVAGVLESIIEAAPVEEAAHGRPLTGLLIAGAGMTIAYAALIQTLGFFLCTVLFLAGFTWVGRYRRPFVILAASVSGGLVFMYVFMKVVYVSLPLGVGPFQQVSVQLMRIMGIH